MPSDYVNYPYPVIKTYTDNFEKTVFVDSITRETNPKGYILKTDFSVNNDQITEMINNGLLQYAVYVVCKTTMLRKMFYITDENPNIEINANEVHYLVSYKAFVICKKDIPDYYNDDFVPEYKGIKFSLKQGDIVAVGEEQSFDAIFEKDIIKDAASIIQVQGSDNEKYMRIELGEHHIQVIIPSDECLTYKNIGNTKSKYPLLHAVLTIPALIEAISTMSIQLEKDPEGDLTHLAWFMTLQHAISKIAEEHNKTEDFLYEHPSYTAQIIFNNNLKTVLQRIDEIE